MLVMLLFHEICNQMIMFMNVRKLVDHETIFVHDPTQAIYPLLVIQMLAFEPELLAMVH